MTARVNIGIAQNIVGTMIFDTVLIDDLEQELNDKEIQLYRTRQGREARRKTNT